VNIYITAYRFFCFTILMHSYSMKHVKYYFSRKIDHFFIIYWTILYLTISFFEVSLTDHLSEHLYLKCFLEVICNYILFVYQVWKFVLLDILSPFISTILIDIIMLTYIFVTVFWLLYLLYVPFFFTFIYGLPQSFELRILHDSMLSYHVKYVSFPFFRGCPGDSIYKCN
jgi:hypothetical protein